ncbi:MAG TPA: exosortase/archaeosortase family protein [Pirellulales bacterium]|nr:exosortase/archaeosortase family protein [Pirellulales bacterium]
MSLIFEGPKRSAKSAASNGAGRVSADSARQAEGAAWRRPAGWTRPELFVGGAALAAAFLWAYGPVLVKLWRIWGSQPDYSHGYLVLPAAAYFAWMRRGSRPPLSLRWNTLGLLLLAISAALRAANSLLFIGALDGWSLPFWAAGVACLLGGLPLLRWLLPSIGFLAFMIPLPYRIEGALSLPLQRVATQLTCWLLECLGEPAVADGNVVIIGDTRLLVAEACSGLRIFISVFAIAYAFCVLTSATTAKGGDAAASTWKPWWSRGAMLIGVLPVAIVANALRIAATALLKVHGSEAVAERFAHDFSGWAMLPLALALMYLLLWYADGLLLASEAILPHQVITAASVAHRQGVRNA